MLKQQIAWNSKIIVVYIYLTSFVALFSFLNINFIIEVILILIVSVYAIVINKLKINKNMIFLYMFLLIFGLINLILVEYKEYVLGDLLNLFLYSFVPIYICSQNRLNYKLILETWWKFSKFFSFMLPLIYLFRELKFISYFDLGYTAHINALILIYFYFILKKKSLFDLILIIVNVTVLTVWGSRLVLLATFITAIGIIVILEKKKNALYLVKVVGIASLVSLFLFNLEAILLLGKDIMDRFNINSRNIVLLIEQLEGGNEEVILSGRDNIYPLVIEEIKNTYGLPKGFGVVRNLTNGEYYHAHNFIFQFILTMGLFSLIFLIYTIIVNIKKTFLYSKQKNYKLSFLFIIFFSFTIRSIAGTNFINDYFFLILFGMLFSNNIKENERYKNESDFS